MLDLLRKYRVYYTIATILVVFGFISLLWFPKGGAVLWFDKHSSEGMDTFFLLITQIGEILGAIIVLLVLVFFADKKFREKDTHNNEFWQPILEDEKFDEFITKKFRVG